MASSEQHLVFEKDGEGIATLTLNRPDRLNAMTTAMWRELPRLLARVAEDDEIKVLVLIGTGQGFCAGSDVSERLAKRLSGVEAVEQSRRELIEQVGSPALAFAGLDKPVIAAVNGIAVGAGLSLALLCDIRIASDRARFGSVWVRRGLIPDLGATYTLPRVVGIEKAVELMVTGELIGAEEAKRIGLVSRVVPHDDLMGAVSELAHKMAAGPAVAIELTKRGIYRSLHNDLKAQLDYESYAQNLCRQTEDFREGVQAFLENRPAVFSGK